MLVFIVSITLVVAVLLVLIILAQNSKGGGLISDMSNAGQVIGTRRTTDWIEKATWTLIITVFVLSMSTVMLVDKSTESNRGISSPNIERAKEDDGASLPTIDPSVAPDNSDPSASPVTDPLIDNTDEQEE